MKRIVEKLDTFNTITLVMNNNEAAFGDFTEITDARDLFISKKTRIAELVSSLNKPYSEYIGVKTDSRVKLRTALSLAIGTGITVATRQKNNPLLVALKNYKTVLSRTTIHDLPEMANRVHTELTQNETAAAGAGLTAEKLTALHDLTANFREIIESTDYAVSGRKTGRGELNTLVMECNGILRDQIDPFVKHCQETFPDFYNAYFTLRAPKKGRKKSVATPVLTDISGVVTNSVTGSPVAGATVILTGDETVYTTDADGYYLIEDVSADSCTISCFANGFDVPQPVQSALATGESLIIDFSLVPVTPAE